jgi:hypothetical protein
MFSDMIKSNEVRDVVNRAIVIPRGRILLNDGRELELTKWAPVLEAGEFVRVSLEAYVCGKLEPVNLDADLNGTT